MTLVLSYLGSFHLFLVETRGMSYFYHFSSPCLHRYLLSSQTDPGTRQHMPAAIRKPPDRLHRWTVEAITG